MWEFIFHIDLSFIWVHYCYVLFVDYTFLVKTFKINGFHSRFCFACHQRIEKKIKHGNCSLFIQKINEIVKVFPYASKIWKHIRHFQFFTIVNKYHSCYWIIKMTYYHLLKGKKLYHYYLYRFERRNNATMHYMYNALPKQT